MEVDKDILISKVLLRNVIWDKRLKDHANRNLVDKAWKEIAVEMGVENDGVLRKKWKYLRNQFAIEVGKSPPPRSGDSGDRLESKWPHFKSLMFLLGIVKPRTSSSNLMSKDSSQDKNFELVAHTNDNTETEPTDGFNEVENQTSLSQQDDSTRTNSPLTDKSSRKRKRSQGNAKYNQQLLSLEQKKASLLERIINERGSDADNDDALFFRSLLPHVGNIPQHLKMRFRNRVQLLVEEFAYGSDTSKQTIHFNSQSTHQYSPEYITLTGSNKTDNRNSSNSGGTSAQPGKEYEDIRSFSDGNW